MLAVRSEPLCVHVSFFSNTLKNLFLEDNADIDADNNATLNILIEAPIRKRRAL